MAVDLGKLVAGVQYAIAINDDNYIATVGEDGFGNVTIEISQSGGTDIFIFNSLYGGFFSDTLIVGEVYNIKISFAEGCIKPLEAKYLDIVNYISDKILIPRQILSFTGDEYDGYFAKIDGINFIEGKKYKVFWDVASYIYTAFNNDVNEVTIGDLNHLMAWNEGEGIRIWAVADPSSSHQVAITEVGECKIKQEYLPNSLYTEIDQRIETYINEALGGEY